MTDSVTQIGPVAATEFAPNAPSPVLAASAPDGTIVIWHFDPTGRARRTVSIPGTGSPVLALRYSMDGGFLVAVDAAGTIRMWDVATTGDPVLLGYYAQPAQDSAVPILSASIAVGPPGPHGGRAIVTATDISGDFIWTSDADQLVNRMCATIGDTLTAAQWSRYVPGTSYFNPCRNEG
jgi:WD40 repeat protein